MDIVELSQSLESDDALLIILDGLGGLSSSHTATLVLGEDVGGARNLRSRTTLAFRLLQLLEVAVVKARLALRLSVRIALRKFLVETVTDALAERIHAGIAARLTLLIAHALIVFIGVEGAGTLQLDRLALSRHLSVVAVGGALADIGTTGLRHGVSLALVVETLALLSATRQHGVLQALTATCVGAQQVKLIVCNLPYAIMFLMPPAVALLREADAELAFWLSATIL